MAPHSSTLAWKIPWIEEPGGLPSMGSHRVRSDLAAAAHPYMTTGKTIALTRQTLVGKVMSLLLNMLSAAAAAKSLSHVRLCVTP